MALTDPDPFVEVIVQDDLVVLGYTGPRVVDVIVAVGAPGPGGSGGGAIEVFASTTPPPATGTAIVWQDLQTQRPPPPVPLQQIRLNVPGVVDNFPRGSDTPVIFGTGIWNDANDATYAWYGWSDNTSNCTHGVFDTYTGGFLSSLTLHFRASATGGTGLQPITTHLHRAGPGYTNLMHFFGGGTSGAALAYYGFPANFDIPNDGVIRDYSVTVDQDMLDYSGWDALDEMRSNLLAGGNYIFFDSDDFAAGGNPVSIIHIYEAWLIVESPAL